MDKLRTYRGHQLKLDSGGKNALASRLAAVFLVSALLLSACSKTVVIQGAVPTPLVSQIPLRLGIYYSDIFKNFSHEESLKSDGNWTIELGQQNVLFFRELFTTLFLEVIEVDQEQLSAEAIQTLGLDGILVPEIEEYGFLTPGISGLKFYSASVKYNLRLLNGQATVTGEWHVVGYGKSEGGTFQGGEAVNSATLLAIRDGGARIAIDFPRQAFVKAFLASLDVVPAKEVISDQD
ncbi:MAG TPA: hypothetical protein EYQ22_15355 [Gammaproteobacteria bacterium]|nr:hypothetical protein [Gammaproteobacteria bacterium]HIK71498.1 hypothetical protein [Pseudomonadales bacterium]